MVRGKNTNGMVMLLLFFAATSTNAAPTINGHNMSLVLSVSSASQDVYYYTKPETRLITGPVDSRLAAIAAELNKPPIDDSDSPSAEARVKSLPPIPGTLLMVLAGFICVSLVRDRKTWLTVLIGLLGLSQAGFAVLPHLAQLLSNRKQVELPSSDVAIFYQPRQDRLRSDIDGTCYIGLLHYLAGIPKSDGSFFQLQKLGFAIQLPARFTYPRTSVQAPLKKQYQTHLSAIITKPFPFISRIVNRLHKWAAWSVYVRSELVLVTIIRGPPHFVL